MIAVGLGLPQALDGIEFEAKKPLAIGRIAQLPRQSLGYYLPAISEAT